MSGALTGRWKSPGEQGLCYPCRYYGSTEAEWEYATRGGEEGLKYPWGNELSSQNVKHDSKDTVPVGSYLANGFGLYDMAGNVWEWCSDWYGKDHYSSSPDQDPQGPSEGTERVRLGGTWIGLNPSNLRCSDRDWDEPVSGDYYVGFRCAREVLS